MANPGLKQHICGEVPTKYCQELSLSIEPELSLNTIRCGPFLSTLSNMHIQTHTPKQTNQIGPRVVKELLFASVSENGNTGVREPAWAVFKFQTYVKLHDLGQTIPLLSALISLWPEHLSHRLVAELNELLP